MSISERRLNFLIGGTQKGGTTSLDHYLRQHPLIAMGRKKELHFFDDDAKFSGKSVDYQSLHEGLEEKSGALLYGESTPIYMYWKPAAQRVFQYNPNMKWILLLRNPIERAFSHWNMEVQRGQEDLNFSDAISSEANRLDAVSPGQHRVHSYVDRGFYSLQIERIQQYFEQDQILILKYESFQSDQPGHLQKIFDFLELPEMELESEVELHRGNYQSELGQEERARLYKVFQEEIEKIEALLNWDCSDWKVH